MDPYYEKYLKYKNKYLQLKALYGGKNENRKAKEVREVHSCERKAVCNFVKKSLPEYISIADKPRADQYKKITNYTNSACDRMEQLEKVNVSSETLTQEYDNKLKQINIYKTDLEKKLKKQMEDPNCELEKFYK